MENEIDGIKKLLLSNDLDARILGLSLLMSSTYKNDTVYMWQRPTTVGKLCSILLEKIKNNKDLSSFNDYGSGIYYSYDVILEWIKVDHGKRN